MSARFLVVFEALSIVALFAGAPSVQAQCASPATSLFAAHATVCPRGDIPIIATVTGASGLVCLNYPVSVTFAGQASTSLTPSPGFSLTTTWLIQAGGAVTIRPRIGGCAMGGFIRYWDPWTGTTLGQTSTINSPDIDGDGRVGLPDLSVFAAAFSGAYKRCADFNVDGVIDLQDLSLLAAHYGH